MTDKLTEYKCEKCTKTLCFSDVKPTSPLCKECELRVLYGVSNKKKRFIRRRS